MCSRKRSAAIGVALSLIADLGIAAGVSAAGLSQPAPVPLPVPYISQLFFQDKCTCDCQGGTCPTHCRSTSLNGHNNCGPASVAMIVEANGRRPAGVSDQAFVAQLRQTMTGRADGPCNPPTDWDDLDRGAAAHGLCLREQAMGIASIEAMNRRCIPVIGLVSTSPANFPGLDNADLHKNRNGRFGDHFIVIVGFDGDNVRFLNPLVAPVPSRSNAVRTTSRAVMITALQNAQPGDFGHGYGDPLGGCDGVGRCNQGVSGSGAGSGAGSSPGPRPVFDMIEISLGHTCSDDAFAFFFKRPEHGGFNERRKVTLHARATTGRFTTHIVQMPAEKGWSGTIERMRMDPVDNHGDDSCLVGLSYLWLRDDGGQTGRYFPFFERAGIPGRPLGRLLDWQTTGGSLEDQGPCCEPNGQPRRSWLLEVTGDDPQIQNDRIDLDTGRDG